ncbi:MAG: chemotaxis protein CheW [Deltaproteobacteria bacterium]|nr:chemotaxis protein CheW [Deltaproteobacteria bacterium]
MTKAGRRYLLFTLQGRFYALDLAQVAEVEEPPLMWPIPGAPSCYPGAMNFHGAIVAVMDLAAFLGHPGAGGREKVIVLDPAIASLAFLVERVVRIVPQEQVEMSAAPGDAFATALLELPEGTATLLDAAAIAARAAETING